MSNPTSSSGWRAIARAHDTSARLNGSFGASAFVAGLRLLVGLTFTLDIGSFLKAPLRALERLRQIAHALLVDRAFGIKYFTPISDLKSTQVG